MFTYSIEIIRARDFFSFQKTSSHWTMKKHNLENEFVVYLFISLMLIIPLHSNNSILIHEHIQLGSSLNMLQVFVSINWGSTTGTWTCISDL